jgi:ribonuclease T2
MKAQHQSTMSRLYLLLLALAAGASATVKSCSITTLSCSNTTAIADTCCFNYSGGQILQTQVWPAPPFAGNGHVNNCV